MYLIARKAHPFRGRIMKKKHKSQKITQKNPPANFYKDLQKLIGKSVHVRIKSDHGFFQVISELLPTDDPNQYRIPNKDGTTMISFNLNLIENIHKDIITLKANSFPVNINPVLYELKIKNYIGAIGYFTGKKHITINYNGFLRFSWKNVPPMLNLNINYDYKNQIFYAKKQNIILEFKYEAIYEEKFNKILITI